VACTPGTYATAGAATCLACNVGQYQEFRKVGTGCNVCTSGKTSKLPFTECYTPPILTESQFKQATWDWVQDAVAAAAKWGDIGDWDVGGVKDFSYAFSVDRDETGGSNVNNGNPKAATFVGTAISKWTTISATTLYNTFKNAGEMNSDLSKWSVSDVTTLANTFRGASKFAGAGLTTWKTTAVTSLENTFRSATLMNADLNGWSVVKVTTMKETFYNAEKFTGGGLNLWTTTALTDLDSTFDNAKEMNNDLGGWNVAKVTSMYHTFRTNSKFTGQGLHLWKTQLVNNLRGTFDRASMMNADLSGWDVVRITNLDMTFNGASTFMGTGLSAWITTSVTSLKNTFSQAVEMNSDLSKWSVAKVTTLENTFKEASKFIGTGLASWNTASVTSLSSAFTLASEMIADLGAWNVGKVTTLWNTFYGASKFAGKDLGAWDTTAVTSLYYTFKNAGEMNVDLSGWTVAKVTTLEFTFSGALKFTGVGLASWDVSAVTTFKDAFTDSTALDSCEKRKIADADAWKNNAAFAANTGYIAAWAADMCPPLTNAQFKQASWGTFDSGRMIELKVPTGAKD
jgi:hypothetical protein